MGGKAAMFFAVQHPEMIDRLVIADIGPKYYAATPSGYNGRT